MQHATTRKEARVQFNGKEILVKEFSMRQYQLVAKNVLEVAADKSIAAKLDSKETADMLALAGELLAKVPERIVTIAKAASADVDEDLVLDATPREILALGLQIWEMNDLVGLFKSAKKALAAPPPAPPPAAPSG